MMGRLSIVAVAFVLAGALVPAPALAQFPCPGGGVITVHMTEHPACEPFGASSVDPPLLCVDDHTMVRWNIDSQCNGKYTVKIVGDPMKPGITGPLICNSEREYDGPVSDDMSFMCPPMPPGIYGYKVAVCRPDGKCRCTDPGIWVNDGRKPPLYVPTQADFDQAQAQAKSIVNCTDADLQKPSKPAAPKKPAPTTKEPKK